MAVTFAGPFGPLSRDAVEPVSRTGFRVRLKHGDRNVIFHVERQDRITRCRQRGEGAKRLNLGFSSS